MSTGPVAQGRSCPQSGLPGAEEASLSASSHWGSHRLHPVVTPSAIGDAYFDKVRLAIPLNRTPWLISGPTNSPDSTVGVDVGEVLRDYAEAYKAGTEGRH